MLLGRIAYTTGNITLQQLGYTSKSVFITVFIPIGNWLKVIGKSYCSRLGENIVNP